jgi:hypothetical protein
MAPTALITEHRAGKQQQQWKVVSGELVSLSAPAARQASGIKQLFASAFLPVGYPDSVTPDYKGTPECWHITATAAAYCSNCQLPICWIEPCMSRRLRRVTLLFALLKRCMLHPALQNFKRCDRSSLTIVDAQGSLLGTQCRQSPAM